MTAQMSFDEALLRLKKVARRHEGKTGELHDLAEVIESRRFSSPGWTPENGDTISSIAAKYGYKVE